MALNVMGNDVYCEIPVLQKSDTVNFDVPVTDDVVPVTVSHEYKICKISFSKKWLRRVHVLKHNTQSSCHMCDRKFYSAGALKEHPNVQHERNVYHCEKAGMG